MNKGKSAKKAEGMASNDLQMKNTKSLMKFYKSYMLDMYNLRKNKHHREIRKSIEGLVDKGYSFRRALTFSLRKYQYIFNDLMVDDIDTDGSETDNDDDENSETDNDGDENTEDLELGDEQIESQQLSDEDNLDESDNEMID